MSTLFEPLTIGRLTLRNRFMRSATAEYLAHPRTGAPQPKLGEMYRRLADGGVGLIVTGHLCVEYSGRTNAHMCALADDALVPAWAETIRPAQEAGARVMAQINHGGANVDPAETPVSLSPSGVATNDLATPRAMAEGEIERVIDSFASAARRARDAGFDGVQIHAAHGYLVSQFLSPKTNLRDDAWGGDEERRMHFFREVARAVRRAVGDDYPVWTKLGVAGNRASGLTMEMGARVAAMCVGSGVDAMEISHALGIPEDLDVREEARYLPMAEAVRARVGPEYPLALVSWLRSLRTMERLAKSEVVDLISLCRPFIAEPDLVQRLQRGAQDGVQCVSCDQCRPQWEGEGVACHNDKVRGMVAAAEQG